MVKEHPILFSGAMVRAILAGRKTQTRRPIKPPPDSFAEEAILNEDRGSRKPHLWISGYGDGETWGRADFDPWFALPFAVGDRLWVRETWGIVDLFLRPDAGRAAFLGNETVYAYAGGAAERMKGRLVYRADLERPFYWRSSTTMPRWASRITLEVTGVHVERVQAISEQDVVAEGFDNRQLFGHAWNSMYQRRGFGLELNPWVWVVEFARVGEPA